MTSTERVTGASSVQLRPARAEDVARVAEIERESFSDPWSRDAFQSLLVSPAVVFAVATVAERVAGYVVMWLAADEGEIANLAVASDVRRQGMGSVLLAHAVDVGRVSGTAVIFLEVRESNVAARALYASHGFVEVGRRKRYYRRPEEDALVLRLDVNASARVK